MAAFEILVYWETFSRLTGYEIFSYGLADDQVEDIASTAPTLRALDREATQVFGTDWAKEKRSLGLKVPSVVLPLSFNYLINPLHPQFDEGRIAQHGPLVLDDRYLLHAIHSREPVKCREVAKRSAQVGS